MQNVQDHLISCNYKDYYAFLNLIPHILMCIDDQIINSNMYPLTKISLYNK